MREYIIDLFKFRLIQCTYSFILCSENFDFVSFYLKNSMYFMWESIQ